MIEYSKEMKHKFIKKHRMENKLAQKRLKSKYRIKKNRNPYKY